jgi:hypothetical protein
VTRGYFAIFRSCTAALLAQGYRATNFHALCVGVEHLLTDALISPREIVQRVQESRQLKDRAYYGRRIWPPESRVVLESAELVVDMVFALLAIPGFEVAQLPQDFPRQPAGAHVRNRARSES